ncbi:MAG: hypothetical protein JNJ59_11255 [Deltaproteobacteria bacterium]|jgi:D-3-phosphoglycerate dehydrogenase|nr:hypothetical protein [Deltaproteobacteria bacterium]
MHVLIADTMTEETRAGLEGLGVMLTYAPDLEPHALPDRVKDVDVLVVGKTRVTRRTIEAGTRLGAVLRAGVGIDTIDSQAASERGIIVADCGEADVHARAELAMGLVVALDRGLHGKAGGGAGMRGRTFGLLGWDPVAQALARIAQGFGMRVLVHAKRLTPTLAAEAGVHWCDSADSLFGRVDVLSLHPEDATPQVMATAERIARLGEGATLIVVTARGLVDLAAAKARLEAGTLRLGLDVYDANDYGDDVPFAADAFPGLLATLRKGGQTRQVEDAINHQLVSAVETFLTRRVMPGAKNLGTARGAAILLVRHRPGPEVLAAIFDALNDGGAAILGLESQSFDGGQAALLRVTLSTPPEAELRESLERITGLLGLEVERG